MLTGPVDVTEKLLKRAGMTIADIDLFELNEAFAAVVLRYMQAFDIDHDKINVNGGAIAMGHPLGATGAMILGTCRRWTTALDAHRHGHGGLQTALVTLCIGAGMGTATIIERASSSENSGERHDLQEFHCRNRRRRHSRWSPGTCPTSR
jgi:acetyl-CoA C-acetyltransferase